MSKTFKTRPFRALALELAEKYNLGASKEELATYLQTPRTQTISALEPVARIVFHKGEDGLLIYDESETMSESSKKEGKKVAKDLFEDKEILEHHVPKERVLVYFEALDSKDDYQVFETVDFFRKNEVFISVMKEESKEITYKGNEYDYFEEKGLYQVVSAAEYLSLFPWEKYNKDMRTERKKSRRKMREEAKVQNSVLM